MRSLKKIIIALCLSYVISNRVANLRCNILLFRADKVKCQCTYLVFESFEYSTFVVHHKCGTLSFHFLRDPKVQADRSLLVLKLALMMKVCAKEGFSYNVLM